MAVRVAGPADCSAPCRWFRPTARPAVRALADRVVCLAVPREFYAVGQFYEDFRAVEDADVLRLLGRHPIGAPLPTLAPVRDAGGRGRFLRRPGVAAAARGLVLFVHGKAAAAGTARAMSLSPQSLQRIGLATRLMDLLTPVEDADERRRFDIPLLASRVAGVLDCGRWRRALRDKFSGLFGALPAPPRHSSLPRLPARRWWPWCRGGRPDLVPDTVLARVQAPTSSSSAAPTPRCWR